MNVIMNHFQEEENLLGDEFISIVCFFRISLIRTDDECLSSHNIEKNVYSRRQVSLPFLFTLFLIASLFLSDSYTGCMKKKEVI